jgi:hypothetical protein
MARPLTVLLFLLASITPLRAADRPIFPDDYTPSACAPKNACPSYKAMDLAFAGSRIHGQTSMDPRWIEAHWKELIDSFAPYCAKVRTCYAQPGNTNLFCDDQLMETIFWECDRRWTPRSEDWNQCHQFYKTYVSGVELNSEKPWLEAQECAKASAKPGQPLRKLEVWTVPEKVAPDFDGKITVYAIDAETRVPQQANVTVADENIWADTPGGRPATGFVFKWKARMIRVPNAEGHTDAVPLTAKVEKEGYETVTFLMPVDVQKMKVEMTPAADQLKPGKNSVTVTTIDARTGKPAEARVMIGNREVAPTNEPFELELKKGQKRKEIWVRCPFGRYGDVVVAPAQR